MFKKSRRKIVATIMFILVLVWVGTLTIIYASSYHEMSTQNEQMLKFHADMYILSQPAGDYFEEKPVPNYEKHAFDPGFGESQMFQLSVFYTVALTYNGTVIETKNESPTVYDDEELEKLAYEIMAGKAETGTVENLIYYKADKGGYMLVTFMDNTIINASAAMLFRYTLIFGGVAVVIFFFFSVFIAGRIVQPLEDSYKRQKQFISDAGHELKTPVSVVSTNAELLAREIGDNKWLSNIQYENERMGMLVCQLLELARTENIVPKTEQIDFSRLVAGETLPLESVAFEKKLILSSNISAGIMVNGNAIQLKQLVSILVDNAIRHSTGGDEVYLSLVKERGFAKLSVVNKGDEIPKGQKEQLFERFYRVDAVRNGEDKHYGLGLAIAKAIVNSHKGKIDIACHDGLVEFRVQIPLL